MLIYQRVNLMAWNMFFPVFLGELAVGSVSKVAGSPQNGCVYSSPVNSKWWVATSSV